MAMGNEKDFKGKLIASVKKEVKQVMEESVTRKYVHEESGSVTSLCGAVEACLSQGLRRRALGLFKTSSTTALLHKIGKHNGEAANISRKVQEIENLDPNRRSSSSSDSLTKPTLKKNASVQSTPLPKYLWIRLALFEKQLAKIIDYLVTNAGKYYDKDALVADPDYGTILSSLLVGPCALDYSRSKTPDHFWTDPPADELVQRHRISSGHSTPPSVRRPILNFRRSLNTSGEDSVAGRSTTTLYAKDYVESLHQNSRATLLFGKNNVLVLPVKADVTEPMPGYLSLHQTAQHLIIKWTPNQLMNGFAEEIQDKSVYWDYALQIHLDEIVYVHCHQDAETGGTVILVGQDGVQRPPIHFPKGGHMLAFLSCIETGLLPRGRLDPPLWSQRSGTSSNRKKRPVPALTESEQASRDYVFRIIDNANKEILKRNELMDTHAPLPAKVRVQLASSSTSSESSTKSFSMDQNGPEPGPQNVCIQAVCDSMKRQIISRAFYGWLAYCRHLNTVRRHLSGLVNSDIISGENASEGLSIDKWNELCVEGVLSDSAEVFRLTYFGGVAEELRKDVWPYLLGHFKFGSTADERNQLNEETKQAYENTMSEWLAVEAIVKQKDKESQANAIAKLSSESMSADQVPQQIQRDLSNDVFEDISDISISNDDDSHEGTPDASRRVGRTKQNTIRYESDEEIAVHVIVVTSDTQSAGDENASIRENQTESSEAFENVEDANDVNLNSEGAEVGVSTADGTREDGNLEDGNLQDLECVDHEGFNADVQPEGVKPVDVKPVDVKPEGVSPEGVKPEGVKHEGVKHEGVKPEGVKPSGVKPEGVIPSGVKPEGVKPEGVKPEDVKPEGVNPEGVKPEGVNSAGVNSAGVNPEGGVTPEETKIREDANGASERQILESQDSKNRHDSNRTGDADEVSRHEDFVHNVIVTNASVDMSNLQPEPGDDRNANSLVSVKEENNLDSCLETHGLVSPALSACVSPASSNGGVYSAELLESFGLNLHRIEKDVQRCDRNYWYFAGENLDKLRNIMCTYVWEHLDIGYMQGMCDLVAPLLVIFNDESLTYACFCHLMERMIENFPNGNAMDGHFANMRSLIQILDSEMYELMHSHGDYTHFYFCYRWFLLDFKRELLYADVFAAWEVIWAAQHVASTHYVLFLALAFLETYRDIILTNSMDFTDIIKFFNEMAERHDAAAVLRLARDLVHQLQLLIENK